MKVSGTLSGFKNSIIDMDIYIDSPSSGFDLTVMETGAGTRDDIFSFSGYEGYVFDQSGRFIGGYRSGTSFNIQTHFYYYFIDIPIYYNK